VPLSCIRRPDHERAHYGGRRPNGPPSPNGTQRFSNSGSTGEVTHRRAYTHDVAAFMAWLEKPLSAVTIRDVQVSWIPCGLADTAVPHACRSQVRALIRHKIGDIPSNVGAAVDLPKTKDKLAEQSSTRRLLTMIHREQKPRNHASSACSTWLARGFPEFCGLRGAESSTAEETGQSPSTARRQNPGHPAHATRWECLQRSVTHPAG